MTFDYESIKETVKDGYGRRVVLSLFSEFAKSEFKPLWSLYKDWKPVYLGTSDPTEYEAAMLLIGDYEHWLLIRNHPKIKPIIDKWQMEMEVKLRSEAVRQMMKHSKSQNGAAAAKWLAEGRFANRDKRTKKGKLEEEQVVSEIDSRVSEDMERLGLSVVKGGK